MKPLRQTASVASAQLAKALLGAWLGGEPSAVEKELDRSCHPAAVSADAAEDERLELLEAVAARMKAHAGLLGNEPMDPSLISCLDLLLHLAHGTGSLPLSEDRHPANRARARAQSGLIRLEIALTPIN